MNHFKQLHHKPSGNSVNWDDPFLDGLLRKTEAWKLDNRGAVIPQLVHILLGWGASTSREAVLVLESEHSMVLETRFPIPQGEQVRVDIASGKAVRTVWGVVVDGREGYRDEDRKNGIHVHWVHFR